MAIRERPVAAGARQQRVQQELPARRRFFDGRRAGVRRDSLAAVMARWAAALIALVAPVFAASAAVTATDDAGNVVTLAQPARRIVSLAPHATELLFAAGAGTRVVRVVAHSD